MHGFIQVNRYIYFILNIELYMLIHMLIHNMLIHTLTF